MTRVMLALSRCNRVGCLAGVLVIHVAHTLLGLPGLEGIEQVFLSTAAHESETG